MDRCRMCDTPLEEGFITGVDLRWAAEGQRRLTAADGPPRRAVRVAGGEAEDRIVEVSASRCPRCQVGVFSYDTTERA